MFLEGLRRLPVDLYAVEGTGEPPAWLADYRQAVDAFREGRFQQAGEAFEAVAVPDAYAAVRELYLDRCRKLVESPPRDWDGAVSLDSK